MRLQRVFFFFSLLSLPCLGQTFTWDGGSTGPGDDNFGTGANWDGDNAPTPLGSGLVLRFTGSTRTTPNNNYTTGNDFGEWRLYTGAGSDFTIGGNGFGLHGKIEVDSGVGRNLTLNTAGIFSRDGSLEINPVGGNITLGSSTPVELDGNATLNVYDGSNSRTLTFNGALSNGNGSGGNGQIILNETATVILAADNDYGGTTLNNGTTLRVGTGGATGTLGSGNTLNNGSLFVNRSTDYTYAGNISGSGSLTKQGAGVLTLSGTSNTYTGKTAVSAGTLSINADARLGNAPGSAVADQLTLSGSTLRVTAATTIALNRGITISGGATLSSSTIGTSANFTVDPIIAGSGGLTLAANGDTSATGGGVGGNLHLNNTANSFTGTVNITSGVVSFNGDGVFGNTSNVINISGGGLVATGNRTLASTRAITLSGGGDKIFRSYGGAVTFTVNGPISGTGNLRHTDGGTLALTGVLSFTGNLDEAGNGTIALSNTGNSYTGYTHIRGGNSIRLDASGVIPNASTVLMYGGTFNVNGQTETIGSLTTGSSSDTAAAVTLGSGNLTVTSNSLPSGMTSGYTNATWHGNISGNGGVTYNQSSGTGVDWTLATANGYSGGTSVLAGRIRAQNTGAFGLGAVTVGDGGAVYLVAGGGTFGNNFSLTGRGANESGVFRGALRVAGNEDVSGQITLNTSANPVRIGNDAGEDLSNGGLVLSGKVTGSGGFEKTGPGTLRLTNTTNDFTGNITITEGHVQTNADTQFGNASNGIVFNGGTFQQNNAANLVIGSGRTLSATAGNAIRLRVWGSGSITVNGPITGASATGLIKSDAGLLVLANSGNSYAGYTQIVDASQIRLDANNVIPDTSSVLIYGNSTFNVNGRTESVAGLHVGSASDTNATVQLGSGANLTVTGTAMPGGSPTNIGNEFYAKITGTGNITYNHSSNAQANWYWRNTANDFVGNTTITSGRLNVFEASLGNAGNDIIFNGDVVSTLNNGEGKASLQQATASSLTLNAGRTITLNTGKEGTLYVWGEQTTEVLGQITGGGNLRKEDGGTLRLSNTSNNYTGQTKLVLGTLTLGAAGVLPDATEVVIANATLNLNGFNETVTGLSSGGYTSGVISGNGGTLFVNGPGNYTYTGRVTDAIGTGNGGIVAYNGTGSLTLSGTEDNGGGRARVDSGTLILAKTSTAGVHAVGTTNSPALFINGGTAQLGGTGGDQIYTGSNVAMTGGTFDLNARNEGFRGLTGAAGTILNNGGGTSSLVIGETSVGADTYTFAGTFGAGSGALNLTKRGGGTQILTGASPFNGSVTVMDGGTLSVPTVDNIGSDQPLGKGASPITFNGDNATLKITGNGSTDRGLQLGANNYTSRLEVDAGVAPTVTLSGSITGGSSGGAFTKAGNGTFNFSGSGNWDGNFNISGGTFNLTGGGAIAGVGITNLTYPGSGTATTLKISTTASMKTASLDIPTNTAVILEAGTLRVGGGGLGLVNGRSIDNSGGTFSWGSGTLAVYTTGSGEAGLTDRSFGPAGTVVKEGNYLSVNGSMTTASGSTLDLGSTYLSNGLRYNQFNVNGTLALNGGTLNIGLNPYFLRPNSPNSITTGDWGTLMLVYANDITGFFAQSGGKTVIPGIGQDQIGWTQLADSAVPVNPSALALNTFVIEYRDGTGGFTQAGGDVILLHYKVAGTVPEPASAGLLVAGALLLRALRRRAS